MISIGNISNIEDDATGVEVVGITLDHLLFEESFAYVRLEGQIQSTVPTQVTKHDPAEREAQAKAVRCNEYS